MLLAILIFGIEEIYDPWLQDPMPTIDMFDLFFDPEHPTIGVKANWIQTYKSCLIRLAAVNVDYHMTPNIGLCFVILCIDNIKRQHGFDLHNFVKIVTI
jgi:hypothetical protein